MKTPTANPYFWMHEPSRRARAWWALAKLRWQTRLVKAHTWYLWARLALRGDAAAKEVLRQQGRILRLRMHVAALRCAVPFAGAYWRAHDAVVLVWLRGQCHYLAVRLALWESIVLPVIRFFRGY